MRFQPSRRAVIVVTILGLLCITPGFVMVMAGQYRTGRIKRNLSPFEEAITVSSESVDPANEGRAVHVTGFARGEETLKDPEFDIEVNGIVLSRDVQICQCLRRNTQVDHPGFKGKISKEVHTKVYRTEVFVSGWCSEHPLRTEDKPYEDMRFCSSNVRIGGYKLSDELLQYLKPEDDLGESQTLHDQPVEDGFALFPEYYDCQDNKFYNIRGDREGFATEHGKGRRLIGRGNAAWRSRDHVSRVGDVRVKFKVAGPQGLSVIGMQSGDTLVPCELRTGESVGIIMAGNRSSDSMVDAYTYKNTGVFWNHLSVVGGFLLILIGVLFVIMPWRVQVDSVSKIAVIVLLAGGGVGLLGMSFGAMPVLPVRALILLLSSAMLIALAAKLMLRPKSGVMGAF